MTTIKAAILHELNKPLQIKHLIDKDPDGYQVKVKVISSGLCGAQVNEITGKKGIDKYLPHLLGHEGFGEVLDTGSNVKKVKKGDFVILHWRPSKGELSQPIKFLDNENKEYGAGPITTFSDVTIVSENRCTKLKDPLEKYYSIYPLVGCAISTSYGALIKEASFDASKNILIYGGGGLGLSLLYWTKIFEVQTSPVVVDIHEEKSLHIDRLGGKFCHVDSVHELEKFDLIFETTGIPANLNSALERTASNAEIILIGQTGLDQEVTFKNFFKIYDGIKMISSRGGLFNPDEDIDEIIEHIHQNFELSKTLISHEITLDEINKGFDLMKDPSAGRVIVNF